MKFFLVCAAATLGVIAASFIHGRVVERDEEEKWKRLIRKMQMEDDHRE